MLVTVVDATGMQQILPWIFGAAQRAEQLRHPNVLAFLDLVEEDKQFGLIGEYLDGEPLSMLLGAASSHSAPFPQGVALRVALDVAQTTISLRNKDDKAIVFGGLAPEAIFIAHFGETMLRHPGVSAAAISRRELIHHPSCISYRAPEQYAATAVGEASDIFSLGVILWEMLAAMPLFGGKTHSCVGRKKSLPTDRAKQIERCCREMIIPRLDQIPRAGGALHPDVVELVHRMLDRDPRGRPQSFEEVETALLGLPLGILADPGDVATTVERLAGRVIAERKNELAISTTVPLSASRAPSERVTSRPEGSGSFSIQIPHHDMAATKSVGRSPSQAPRPRLTSYADDAFPSTEAQTAKGPVRSAPLSENSLLDSRKRSTQTDESESSDSTSTDSSRLSVPAQLISSSTAIELDRAPSNPEQQRRWPILAVGALAILISAGVVLLRTNRDVGHDDSRVTFDGSEGQVQLKDAAGDKTGVTQSATPLASASPSSVEAQHEETKEGQQEQVPPAAGSPPIEGLSVGGKALPKSAPHPTEKSVAPAPKKPSAASKGFRPKGI